MIIICFTCILFNMKKIKLISVYVVFILSFFSHFVYDAFPNSFFSLLFPVNESIWEHMKLIITPVLIYGIIEYIIYKRKKITYNNFLFSYSIAIVIGIIIYLIIYLPIHYMFGHNLLFSIALLFIIFILIEFISYKIMKYKEIKHSNLIGTLIILLMYFLFGVLTYYPPKIDLFYDTQSKSYGIKNRI